MQVTLDSLLNDGKISFRPYLPSDATTPMCRMIEDPTGYVIATIRHGNPPGVDHPRIRRFCASATEMPGVLKTFYGYQGTNLDAEIKTLIAHAEGEHRE